MLEFSEVPTSALAVIAAYGLWFAITQSHIPGWHTLRDRMLMRSPTLTTLFDCAFCSCFWLTMFVYLVLTRPTSLDLRIVVLTLAHGFAGSSIAMTLNAAQRKLEA